MAESAKCAATTANAAARAGSGCCAAAVAVADAGGIGALTIRSLAQELGVKPMSVYHHVANKDEILDGIVDLVFSEIELPAAGGDWRAEMRRRATLGARRCCGRHPLGDPAAGVAHQPRARRRCATTTRSSAPCARRASRWS